MSYPANGQGMHFFVFETFVGEEQSSIVLDVHLVLSPYRLPLMLTLLSLVEDSRRSLRHSRQRSVSLMTQKERSRSWRDLCSSLRTSKRRENDFLLQQIGLEGVFLLHVCMRACVCACCGSWYTYI